MLRIIVALCCTILSVSQVNGETIKRPSVKPGDSWTYQATTEHAVNTTQQQSQFTEKHYEVTITRAGSENILLSKKERGSKQPPLEILVGSDWSQYRSINGEETVVNQPLKFPLEEGNSWELKFTENRPTSQLKHFETQLTYKVVGWEEISVPAGKFKALKIEANGKWKSELEASTNTSTSSRTDRGGTTMVRQAKKSRANSSTGRLYSAYWYVPEAKINVKSVEERFSSNGTLARRNTEELESFKVRTNLN